MDPAALAAASELGFAKIRVLLAWEEGGSERRLVGVWALRSRRPLPFWPTLLEALPYNYAFLSSPVVDPACAAAVIAALLAAIEKCPSLPKVISLHSLDAECPSYPAMLGELIRRGTAPLMLSRHARPCVTSEFGVKRSGSTRKKLRQDWNRLSALGTVDVINDRAPEGARQAFECFLALEKASWKGARGTALLSGTSTMLRLCGGCSRTWLRRATRRSRSCGWMGGAISRTGAAVLRDPAYTWKTAFDAHYGKYSPGALLIDRITDELFAGSDVRAINSCAVDASFMGSIMGRAARHGRYAGGRAPSNFAGLPNRSRPAVRVPGAAEPARTVPALGCGGNAQEAGHGGAH